MRTTASVAKDWVLAARRVAATTSPGFGDGGGLTPEIPSRGGTGGCTSEAGQDPECTVLVGRCPERTGKSWIGAGGPASSAGKRSRQLITRTSRSSAALSPSGARLRAVATRAPVGNTRSRWRSRSNERARWRFCPTSVIPRSRRRDLARASRCSPVRSWMRLRQLPSCCEAVHR